MLHNAVLPFLLAFALTTFAVQIPATSLASQYSLTTSTSFPFPTTTLATSDTQHLLVSQWSLGKGRIQNEPNDLAFVDDPFPSMPPTGDPSVSSPSGPVLQVTYPAHSFSHDSGGAQFYNLWNTTDGSKFETMVLTYEIAFDTGFDWVKGGKLPGLRGGLNSTGCSGGNKATGLDCFSSRVMFRPDGIGEVYAYIPTPNNLCSDNEVICNTDFGISFSRGSFGFVSGRWNRVTMLVQLNNPPNVANGNIQLYFNDVLALNHTDLQIRASTSVAAGGLYFSTFFGGDDSTWATPNTTHTYFRALQMWGGSNASTLVGNIVKSNGALCALGMTRGAVCVLAMTWAFLLLPR